ncbi:MAG: HDOD domain-containing protein [Pseudomonadota bacterium]
MTATVLDCITLGYQPLWGRQRLLSGIALFVRCLPRAAGEMQASAAYLLDAMRDLLPRDAPPVFLVAQSGPLLLDLLDQVAPREPAAPDGRGPVFATNTFLAPTLVVTAELLEGTAGVAEAVRRAHQRGLQLVWQGSSDSPPAEDIRACFYRYWLTLPPPWAAAALLDAVKPVPFGSPAPPGRLPAGHIYSGIESRTLMEYCLDRCGALAIAGWPAEDVVYSLRHHPMQPAHTVVLATLKALESDRSAETVERILSEDPILAYRFLIYANSPGLGLRSGVESVRHGMMMLGIDTLKTWLAEQLPHASNEPALRPINATLVIRSHLMDRLLDAGIEEALRREVTLCGLFSGLDLLLNEHLSAILHRLPLSHRIHEAMVLRTGPYAASLEVALALESADTPAIRVLCQKHEMAPGEVNRALLEMLAGLEADEAQGPG